MLTGNHSLLSGDEKLTDPTRSVRLIEFFGDSFKYCDYISEFLIRKVLNQSSGA